MPKLALAAGLVLFLWPVSKGDAQYSGTTTLVLQVNPEASLNPRQLALNFRISQDGTSDVTAATVTIDARVRAVPGHAIRLTAQLMNLDGPEGPLPAGALRWSGSVVAAAGGGRRAGCGTGLFASGAAQDLVQGWQTSGILTCAVTFQLAEPRRLPAGLYTGSVKLALPEQSL